jgi:transcriptional regulator with XRE-family HTH domain
MTLGAPRSFEAQLKALREAAGYTQEELATIAGLSVHAVSALERGGTTPAPCRNGAARCLRRLSWCGP